MSTDFNKGISSCLKPHQPCAPTPTGAFLPAHTVLMVGHPPGPRLFSWPLLLLVLRGPGLLATLSPSLLSALLPHSLLRRKVLAPLGFWTGPPLGKEHSRVKAWRYALLIGVGHKHFRGLRSFIHSTSIFFFDLCFSSFF